MQPLGRGCNPQAESRWEGLMKEAGEQTSNVLGHPAAEKEPELFRQFLEREY